LPVEAGDRESRRDAFAGEPEAHQERRELTRRARRRPLRFEDETIQRHGRRERAHRGSEDFLRVIFQRPVVIGASPDGVVVKVPSTESPDSRPTKVVRTSQLHCGSWYGSIVPVSTSPDARTKLIFST